MFLSHLAAAPPWSTSNLGVGRAGALGIGLVLIIASVGPGPGSAGALTAGSPLTPWAMLSPVQAPAVAVAPSSSVVYTPPVDAPIIDPFRPPESFAGPGNRGIEYGVTAGTTVRAAGDGVVVFAGQVGGDLYITISHADGVDTTYSYLAELLVAAGETVVRGQPIATTGAIFHFGAKIGDAYLDPESLFAASGPGGAAAVLGSDPVSAGTAILLPTEGD